MVTQTLQLRPPLKDPGSPVENQNRPPLPHLHQHPQNRRPLLQRRMLLQQRVSYSAPAFIHSVTHLLLRSGINVHHSIKIFEKLFLKMSNMPKTCQSVLKCHIHVGCIIYSFQLGVSLIKHALNMQCVHILFWHVDTAPCVCLVSVLISLASVCSVRNASWAHVAWEPLGVWHLNKSILSWYLWLVFLQVSYTQFQHQSTWWRWFSFPTLISALTLLDLQRDNLQTPGRTWLDCSQRNPAVERSL